MNTTHCDILVIGAGIAGASLAWALQGQARVIVLEQEDQPGYHATGRSAASFIASYGHDNPALRTLTAASQPWLTTPPHGFAAMPLLTPRGLLTIFTQAEGSADDQFAALQNNFPNAQRWRAAELRARVPMLRDAYSNGGWFEPDAFDIDVHALHQGYLAGLRQQGGQVLCGQRVLGIEHTGALWQVTTGQQRYQAPIIVNAAGAWADHVGQLAGAAPLGLQPLRRTAVMIDMGKVKGVESWPLIVSREEGFYFIPGTGAIMASPGDEHPAQPADVQPEELDIATAIDCAERALQLNAPTISARWAGLRTFAPDRTPVIGWDPGCEGLLWLCGQGGHGIQTAPACAALAVSLLQQQALPISLQQLGFDPAWVAPARAGLGP